MRFRYTLRSASSVFAVNSTSGRVFVTSATLNYEARSSYSFVVRVTDKGGLYAEAPLSVSVIDENDAPVFVGATLSVWENSTMDGVVGGPLSVFDEDANEVDDGVITTR